MSGGDGCDGGELSWGGGGCGWGGGGDDGGVEVGMMVGS